MIVEALDKEWNVNDCTYKQRRELHALNAKVWWEGKQDVGAYYELLDKVSEIAGLGENDFDDMRMSDIDIVLQTIFIDYLGLSKKAIGD
tara:strand:- start:512 stop:778 length:267 start_codon:yes stop_codon:yes gene_type:complete